MITVNDLVRETGATRADVLALVDQLTTLDGSKAVVLSEDNGQITLSDDAASVIRAQFS